MTQYYFLSCAFPKIKLGEKPELSSEALRHLMDMNLSCPDKKMLSDFLLLTDLDNLRRLWLERPLDIKGNLSPGELEDALQRRDFFPDYVFDFIDRFESNKERLQNFSELLVIYFREREREGRFFKNYFMFERYVRLILCALRAKAEGSDVAVALQYEDPQDILTAYILAQKDMDSFEPPAEYAGLKRVFMENMTDPLRLYYAVEEYRFEKIGEMIEPYPFSADFVFGFLAQLIIVENWAAHNRAAGREIISSLIG